MSSNHQVPFFNYPHIFLSHEEAYIDIIRKVGRRGAFILQQDVTEFEQNLAEFSGAKHVIGVANCTDGLLIALKAAGLGEGDEVIFSSHTFIATASAIHFTGATPVPVECGPDHLIDPTSVEAAITQRTKAIMPTQLNGRVAKMDQLQEIADKHSLLIIEDAAQALGAKYKGKYAGTFGLASAFSFYPAKNLGAFGDAGAIFTNDDVLHEKMRFLHNHGRDETGHVFMWGYNSRLDNLHAAILNHKLAHYQQEIDRRREIASLYQAQLKDVAELVLPPPPDSDPDNFDVYQNYEIEAEERNALKAHLKKYGVGTIIQWSGKPVHQFKNLGFDVSLPYTDKLFTRCLLIPMNTSLSNKDVMYVCNKIRQFYGYKQIS